MKNGVQSIHRKRLASKAFQSRDKLLKLGNITHKYIVLEIEKRLIIEKLLNNIIIDAATLFESGADRICGFTISVNASKGIGKIRIIKRGNLSVHDAEIRINAQPQIKFYESKSDYILYGGKSINLLREDIKRIVLEVRRG